MPRSSTPFVVAETSAPQIGEALLHCNGIGPVRLAHLHSLGIRSWTEVLAQRKQIPSHIRESLVAESYRCLNALAQADIGYFLSQFVPLDRWRVLAHYRERATFFDIETTGLEYDAQITAICCWHRGKLHTFVENENLDDFLDLIDDVELLVSFNGATFDVPRVLDGFHIPNLPCPHLDLRWPCYHRGYPVGLKSIAHQLQIQRPSDLQDADGAMAVTLWERWVGKQDSDARELLLRYCASDVLMLAMVSDALTSHSGIEHTPLWEHLPGQARSDPQQSDLQQTDRSSVIDFTESIDSNLASNLEIEVPVWSPPAVVGHFGSASPQKLRGRRGKICH